jgi:hypothetical protein
MKKIILYFLGAFLLITTMSGCKKDIYGCTDPYAYNYNSGANVSNGSCIYYGNVMFWTNVNEGVVTITINNQSATITGYVTGGIPNCGNSVSANFSLPAGSYPYTAVGPPSPAYPTGYSISGTAQVIGNQCNLYQL